MPLVMPHDENRARLIKKEMQLQQNDPTPLPTAKLIIKGKTNVSPIYRFRLDDLYYNKANGRIKAEVSELEAQLGINLDMSDEKDRLRVKDLLLNIRKEENDKIRDDLIKKGKSVSSNYSWRKTAEETLKVYRRILN